MCLCWLCVICGVGVFFFFKQKTAYEMRISDWSSDVCSSDLAGRREQVPDRFHEGRIELADAGGACSDAAVGIQQDQLAAVVELGVGQLPEIGRASCRERVWQDV